MDRQPVASSFIKAIGYDPATNILEVELAHGVYRYANVTPAEHEAFIHAESIGKHFGQFIKNRPSMKEEPNRVNQ